MRLVIDLQGAQSASRHRGIGRYSLSLAQAMVQRAGNHDVWIALNGAVPETIEPLRAAFDTLLPQERIVVWDLPAPVASCQPANEWRRTTGEILRESVLADLKPDIVHVSSLFEGFGDDVVTSVGKLTEHQKTAVTLYDLIPLIHQDLFLTDPNQNAWYRRKLSSLQQASLWLAISESSRKEGLERLNLPPERVFNISAAANSRFRPLELKAEQESAIRGRYGLARPFVLYTGSTDPHKNLAGLLNAYSILDLSVRRAHQLLIVCPAREGDIAPLRRQAQQAGLSENEVVFAPFVPDGDLVALYNLATAFCLPSQHEGFGLPALEAMQCGTATIGSNTSSIPEVIGRADALFDPRNSTEMAARLNQVLTDEGYRRSLIEHGLQQAQKFSWDESARRAWAAFEQDHERAHPVQASVKDEGTQRIAVPQRPRLAYVSPLLPEDGPVADLNSMLLPELSHHYDIEVVSDHVGVQALPIQTNIPIRSMESFENDAENYDRILYHFCGGVRDLHMLELLRQYPGVVVYHDLSSGADDLAFPKDQAALLMGELYRTYGYSALAVHAQTKDTELLTDNLPIGLSATRYATGVIFNSSRLKRQARQALRGASADEWIVIPSISAVRAHEDRATARKALNIGENDFVVCLFGDIEAAALDERLHRLRKTLDWAGTSGRHIVLVDDVPDAGNGDTSSTESSSPSVDATIRFISASPTDAQDRYLAASDVAVVLGDVTRDANMTTVVECMANGLPTVFAGHASMLQLQAAVGLPADFTDDELCSAIERLRLDKNRQQMNLDAREIAENLLSPHLVAERYQRAIEDFARKSREVLRTRTMTALAAVNPRHDREEDWLALARAFGRNFAARNAERQLLVDISELAQRDARTGIQRVTRSILKELLVNPPEGFRVEPVYATYQQPGYRYARRFTAEFLGCPKGDLRDELIETQCGDVFLGLDLQHHVTISQQDTLADMRRRGIGIHFVVYDLLPILLPHAFSEGSADWHSRWLSTLQKWADGIVCISRSVADEFIEWLDTNGENRERPLSIGWFHLGADIEMSSPSRGLPANATSVLEALRTRPSFLSVGTIEPRKGHAQTLEAFERLWASGIDINLVLVGKQGWKVEDLVERLHDHPERNKRLFWLEGISDEYLDQVYAASVCLIAASEGEGFGLPLIEAARHGIPILARDIPVFREVAGGHASFFSGGGASDLAEALEGWLILHTEGTHPRSTGLPSLTWSESADRLMAAILRGEWYKLWAHPGRTPRQNKEQNRRVQQTPQYVLS